MPTHNSASANRLYNEAMRLFVGKKTPQNWKKAFNLMLKAADLGSTKATSALGSFYDYGVGTTRDSARAFKNYQVAALAGDPDAQCNLGICYMIGMGVRKDRRTAIQWL